MLSAEAAATGLERFVAASESGKKIFFGPLFSAADLAGLARANNPATHLLPAATVSLFQASVQQQGQGFTRPLRNSETNLDGAPGQLPAGYEFLATTAGFFWPTAIPSHVKDHLSRHSAMTHVRHSSHWDMGATTFWPQGNFGHTSASASTTVANTTIEYGTNGAVGARSFPDGGEMYFPAKEVIRVDVHVYEPVFITTDGLPANGGVAGQDPGGNEIPVVTGCLIYVVFEGWRFEALTT